MTSHSSPPQTHTHTHAVSQPREKPFKPRLTVKVSFYLRYHATQSVPWSVITKCLEVQLKIFCIRIYRQGCNKQVLGNCNVCTNFKYLHEQNSYGGARYSWISRSAGLRAGFEVGLNLSGIRVSCPRTSGNTCKNPDWQLRSSLLFSSSAASASASNLNKTFRPVHQKLRGLSWSGWRGGGLRGGWFMLRELWIWVDLLSLLALSCALWEAHSSRGWMGRLRSAELVCGSVFYLFI